MNTAANITTSTRHAAIDPKAALANANIVCGDCPYADYDPTIDLELHICGLGRRFSKKPIFIGQTLGRRPYACPLKWNRALAQDTFPEAFQATH